MAGDHLLVPTNQHNPKEDPPMTTNSLSLAPRSSSALLAKLVPALAAASLAIACAVLSSPWHFVASGGVLRLLRCQNKLRRLGFALLLAMLAFRQPEPLPTSIVERVARSQVDGRVPVTCYVAPR
jgi:hypothetical protein